MACASLVAEEIERILREDSVRDRKTGVPRRASAGDIGVLFRSRASHREFERELERRGIPAYVYKGLGFFDADETKDAMALDPLSRQPGVGPAGGGVSAIALRPALGCGARHAGAATGGRAAPFFRPDRA